MKLNIYTLKVTEAAKILWKLKNCGGMAQYFEQ